VAVVFAAWRTDLVLPFSGSMSSLISMLKRPRKNHKRVEGRRVFFGEKLWIILRR
jgi:hypothetical protein